MIILVCILSAGYLLLFQPFSLAEEPPLTDATAITIPGKHFFLSVEEILTLKKMDPLSIIVDVRNEKAFKKTRIPQSINIRLPFIKTKQYLLGMKVVLVDNGYNFTELLREATLLKEKGFDISILAGGLAAWHQRGGQFEGDLFDMERFHYVSAHYLLPGNRSPLFQLYIDVSPQQNSEVQIYFPGKVHIPVQDKNDLQQLIAAIEKRNPDPLSAVLIFNIDGDYIELASLTERCGKTVFFLKGGLDGYQKAVAQQLAILQSREQRLKKVGGCATCQNSNENKKNKVQ